MEPSNVLAFDLGRRAPVHRLAAPASIFEGRQAPFVLFDAAGEVATPAASRTVFVSPGDLDALLGYLRDRLPALIADPRVDAADRAWALYRLLYAEAAAVLAGPVGGAATTGTRALSSIAGHLADFAIEAPWDALAGTTRDPDPEPAVRAAQTACSALALAAADGVPDHAVLSTVVVASVFADAGKLTLPRELLDSTAPLSDEQRALVQEHPARSAELLRAAGVRTEIALAAVRAHHERWDGSGYPLGLCGQQIPRVAQYLAVADSFTALTVERPFAPPRSAYEALLEMSRSSGQFEPQLLRCFVQLLGDALGSPARRA